MSNSQSKELNGIQFLRGIAAIMVVLAHVVGMSRFSKYFNFQDLPTILTGKIDIGKEGVRIFFVISGFIISYVSLTRNTLMPKMDSKTFFKRRFIRIIPFMWACIFAFAAIRFFTRGIFNFSSYFRAFILFPIGDVEPNQIWTLRHEFLFYSVFCFSVIYLKFKLKWLVLIGWFISPLFWYGLKINTLFAPSDIHLLFDFIFSMYNILFGFGCLIGVLYHKGYLAYSLDFKYGFILSLLSVTLFAYATYFTGIINDSFTMTGFMICGIISSIVLITGISIHSSDKKMSFIDKIGLALGNASYSIYLTHGIFVAGILGVWSRFQPKAKPEFVWTTIILIVCIGGVIIYRWVEKPIIKFSKRVFFEKTS